MRITLIFLFLGVSYFAKAQTNVLQQLIEQHPAYFQSIFNPSSKHQAQVIYTQINRDAQNHPAFTTYTLNLDTQLYFYPASTVKMPIAFLALEKLNNLNIINLNKNTPMRHGVGRAPQTEASVDVTAENLLPSVAHYVKKIFLVSDNDASNRLYEWLGQKEIHETLQQKGFQNTRILHRLSVTGFDVEGNRYTNPVSFYHNDQLLYHQGEKYSSNNGVWQLKEELKGKGYLNEKEELVNQSFDFRTKNFVALSDLHNMIKAVIFPEATPVDQRFRFSEEDYRFLYRVMSTKPRESKYPSYPDKQDGYVKFFMYGDTQDTIPASIRIFNKVGWAYGFLTDVAYIVDFERNIEFMLSATICVNEDEVYNDGKYEYETVGLPFFGNLGRVVYEFEKERKRKYAPNLNKFKIEKYD